MTMEATEQDIIENSQLVLGLLQSNDQLYMPTPTAQRVAYKPNAVATSVRWLNLDRTTHDAIQTREDTVMRAMQELYYEILNRVNGPGNDRALQWFNPTYDSIRIEEQLHEVIAADGKRAL